MSNKLYRPSNGTEGMIFMEKFCDKCKKNNTGDGCKILADSLCFEVNEPEYPKEWVYDENNKPTCTSFTTETVKRKKVYNDNDGDLFEMKGG